jgi:hypothetical protein
MPILVFLSLILLAFPNTDTFAQDVIYGCVNKSGHVRIVDDPNECKTSETAIYWNVVGGQGPQGDPGLPGEDGLHCWDLNGNGDCDPAEDINTDGLCDALDCQGAEGPEGQEGPPGEGAVKAYSNDGDYLGLLVNISPSYDGAEPPGQSSITFFVPSVSKFFEVGLAGGFIHGGYGTNIYDPRPGGGTAYVYYSGSGCTGIPYVNQAEYYGNEGKKLYYHVITFEGEDGLDRHYVPVHQPGQTSIGSEWKVSDSCSTYLEPVNMNEMYRLDEVTLPFDYPIELPLSFE